MRVSSSEHTADAGPRTTATGIIGIGVDIVEREKVASFWLRHLRRAGEAMITPGEWHECLGEGAGGAEFPRKLSEGNVRYLAERFAAKEATMKVLGAGIDAGHDMKDIEVLGRGRLAITLAGAWAAKARQRGIRRFHGSCSSGRHYAVACVIGEGSDETPME